MSKFEAFVVKHDGRILNYATVLFLAPVIVFAFIGDSVTAVSLLGGYVVFGALFSFVTFGDIRRSRRRNRALALTQG